MKSITHALPICACGKRCHATKEAARQRYPKTHVYRCPLSGTYHISSPRAFRG